MNMPMGNEDQPWVNNYIEKMMQDRKYIEDAYNRIQSQKIFEWAETQVKPKKKKLRWKILRKCRRSISIIIINTCIKGR